MFNSFMYAIYSSPTKYLDTFERFFFICSRCVKSVHTGVENHIKVGMFICACCHFH